MKDLRMHCSYIQIKSLLKEHCKNCNQDMNEATDILYYLESIQFLSEDLILANYLFS
jgi:hypothetical protein